GPAPGRAPRPGPPPPRGPPPPPWPGGASRPPPPTPAPPACPPPHPENQPPPVNPPGPPAPAPPVRPANPPPPPPQAEGPPRQITIVPRQAGQIHIQNFPKPDGESAVVVTGGVILTVRNLDDQVGLLDIEADRLVFWTRGDSQQLFNNLRSPQGETGKSLEFYLAGNVEIRQQTDKENRLLRADEVYYNVARNVAYALRADLELKRP